MKESFLKINDKLKLYVCRNEVENPKAQLLFIHGYTEHCRRYDKLVEVCNNIGYNVIRYDQRGYGRSEGKRAYINRFQEYNDDLLKVIDAEVDLKLPLFIGGASMGGLILVKHLIDHGDEDIAGALLLSPALKIDDDISPLLRKMSGFLGRFFPWLKTIKLESKFLSRDPEVEKEYLADPLIYKKGAYARTASEMLKSMEYIQDKMDKISCPITILHGTADKLTDPEGSRKLNDMASSEDKSIHLFEGFYHELLNEPDNEKVFTTITSWLNNEKRILAAPVGPLMAKS
jgi:alpha-beta hydrolase superfamily lysophospholipase